MKNHITQSIFDTANTLPSIEAVDAINQLLIEACNGFEGVNPNGFKYRYHSDSLKVTWALYAKHDERDELYYGYGSTLKDAYKALVKDIKSLSKHGAFHALVQGMKAFDNPTDLRTETLN